ncbi:MAG TPA: histidine kinase [Steroidobacteraceae bacterium]|nr:histidine kinase [Steroidobacteraceae bacterium]
MPLKKSGDAPSQRRASPGPLRLIFPPALNWVLLGYAVVAIAVGWAYVASRIHADYVQTLQAEHNRLRGVGATLRSATLAMLNDGVGAAVAGANELQSVGGIARAGSADISSTLQKQLTGGDYVRFLFLADNGRFALASRERTTDSRTLPEWLTTNRAGSGSAWVGRPMADPERPGELVIPIAQRVASGEGSTAWAGGLFSFDGFDELYGQFRDQILMMGLIAADGTVLVRSPKVAGRDVSAGDNVASNQLFQRAIAAGNAGIIEGYGSVVKKDVIYAYDLMNGYPVYIFVGQARDAALAPWRERRQMSIGATAAFTVLMLVMTALLNHYVYTLRRREHHYRTLFNNAQFSAFLLEGERFVDANTTAVRMFGLPSARAAAGLAPWELSPEHQPDGQRSEELARTRIQTALRDGGTTFEWLHKRADTGETFPAEVDLSSLSTGRTVLALAVVHDVTVRKRAEHDLHVLSAELMRLQDEERRRIGRDLHDSTGQTLAALELGLSQLRQDTQGTPDARRELLEHCARLATQCSAEIRTASYLLHPPLLDELGLLSALRWLADGFYQRSAIEMRLDLPASMHRLPPDDELCLFRIAQEALTNVHRHAGSPWAVIRLKMQSNSVMLEIEDAGRGIDAKTPVLGVGLAGMRERIRQIGGIFSIEATGTGGTRVRTTIAIRSQRQSPCES